LARIGTSRLQPSRRRCSKQLAFFAAAIFWAMLLTYAVRYKYLPDNWLRGGIVLGPSLVMLGKPQDAGERSFWTARPAQNQEAAMMGSANRPGDGNMDFGGYADGQLKDLQFTLDREAYPLNYTHLLKELARRGLITSGGGPGNETVEQAPRTEETSGNFSPLTAPALAV
jgi:hypothetical protein